MIKRVETFSFALQRSVKIISFYIYISFNNYMTVCNDIFFVVTLGSLESVTALFMSLRTVRWFYTAYFALNRIKSLASKYDFDDLNTMYGRPSLSPMPHPIGLNPSLMS